MQTLVRLVSSSIGRKLLVASVGFLLCLFLVTHLAGNLFLFVGPNAFNTYARVLESNPLLPLIELALLGVVLLHAVVALYLNLTSLAARPAGYMMKRTRGGRTWGSATMVYTAVLIGAFLVVHVLTFKYGVRPSPEDLYGLVMSYFGDWRWTLFYALVMLSLGLHLSHGAWSACQTFGIDHPKYTPLIKGAGLAFAIVVTVVFTSIPIWACFARGGAR